MRLVLVCAVCIFTFTAFAAEDPFVLLCEYGSGDFQSSKNLKVDSDMHTIDGQPATFTDTLITFNRTDEGKNCHYEINRLNGDFTYDCQMSNVGLNPLTGQCKKAPPREF